MPLIPQYNAPIKELNPYEGSATTARESGMIQNKFSREEGESLGQSIARAGDNFGKVIDQHETSLYISQGSAAGLSMNSGLQQSWHDTLNGSQVNDLTVGQKFLEQNLNPALDKYTKAFDGAPEAAKRYAMDFVDRTRQDFTRSVNADMATRTGMAVDQNVQSSEKFASVNAYNDPTSLDAQIEHLNAGFKGMVDSNPNLTPAKAEE